MNRKTTIIGCGLIAFLIGTAVAAFCEQDPTPFLGDWQGTIEFENIEVTFHFKLNADKKIIGTVDVPAEGHIGDAVDAIKIEGKTISFTLPNAPGNPLHKGMLDETGKTMAMTIYKNDREMKVTLTKI